MMATSSRWRAALAAAAASAVIVAALLMSAPAAQAQPYPPGPPSLTLSATTVDAGDDLSFTGTGFEPDQGVVAVLFSRGVLLGRFTADSHGTVSGTVTIPRGTKPGPHKFKLKARKPHLKLKADLMVRAPHLAATGGGASIGLLGGAAGLITVGGGVALVARRLRKC